MDQFGHGGRRNYTLVWTFKSSPRDRHIFLELRAENSREGKDIGGELSERLTVAGTAIDPGHTVATNSFVVEPPRRKLLIGTAKSVWLEEVLIRDVVINYIKEGGPIDALLPPTKMEE